MKALHRQYILIDTIKGFLQQAAVWVAIGVTVWIIAVIVSSI